MKLVYKGYVYEAYSKENSSLLQYARSWGDNPYDIDDLRFLFRDWMMDNHPELEDDRDLYEIESLPIHELKSEYGEYFDDFYKALDRGTYSDEPEVYASPSRTMDLRNKQLLNNNTWLIHFSDNASYIADEGFTLGVVDLSKMGITKRFDYTPEPNGYNFAFIANSKDASFAGRKKKYGKDAVMFRSTGVHVYHSGDDENQVVFYGPDVKEFVLIKNIDGDFKVIGNSKYTKRDYLFDSSLTQKREDQLTQCMNWVETNWQQYKDVLFWRVK